MMKLSNHLSHSTYLQNISSHMTSLLPLEIEFFILSLSKDSDFYFKCTICHFCHVGSFNSNKKYF